LHENVLKKSKIKIKTAIAGGGGIERLAMIKYGIDDIRKLYNGDLRLLKQVNGGNK
jgi:phenylalanyl-tRNA synthetase alpha chain